MDQLRNLSIKSQITKAGAVDEFKAALAKMEDGKKYDFIIKDSKAKRTLDANAQIHVWFAQIAFETGEAPDKVKQRCKRDIGLPILLADPDWLPVSWMLKKCGFWNLTDDQQLKIMRRISVTSEMTTKQCNDFRDAMRANYAEHGIDLRYVGEPPLG